MASEALDFPPIREAAARAVEAAVASVLEGQHYAHARVPEWTDRITSQCLQELQKFSNSLKFICSCIIIEQRGAGVNYYTAATWDPATDGSCTSRWENDSMVCLTTVYGLAL